MPCTPKAFVDEWLHVRWKTAVPGKSIQHASSKAGVPN
jgi:hypothetical protein